MEVDKEKLALLVRDVRDFRQSAAEREWEIPDEDFFGEESDISPQDDLIRFEAMDRINSVGDILETLLHGHPGLKNGNLKKRYCRIERELWLMYQEAGMLNFSDKE